MIGDSLRRGAAAASPTQTRAGLDTAAVRRLRRRYTDIAARWLVGAGGLATILSIVAILGFISSEVAPLLRSPHAKQESRVSIADAALLAGTDEYRDLLQTVTPTGQLRFLDLRSGALRHELPWPGLEQKQVVAARRAGKDQLIVATADGAIAAARLVFDVQYQDGQRQMQPRIIASGSWQVGDNAALTLWASSLPSDDGIRVVYVAGETQPTLFAISETRNLFGAVNREETRHLLPLRPTAVPAAIAVDARGTRAYIATADGFLYFWDLTTTPSPSLIDIADVTSKRTTAVTAMAFLNGDQSLVVGDARGQVSIWQPLRDTTQSSGWRLQRIHELAPHSVAVTAIAVSPRDKSFLSGDASGEVVLRHATSEQTLLRLNTVSLYPGRAGGGDGAGAKTAAGVAALSFAPKANGFLALNVAGELSNWQLENPHPEITWRTLFGKVWYEGYSEPAYVWQSTGGTDDFEAKFSLVPLILGTVKGTLYALFFAVPIAVLAALYTSQFCHPTIRNIVKPTVEIMAALPSVVLGFLAGLWLAPLIERQMPGVLAALLAVPLGALGFGALWHSLPATWRRRAPAGCEVVFLVPLIVALIYACLGANDTIEQFIFGGNFTGWLQSTLGSRFDQRNCVVVGFAMGFAVIPLIFTVSEDALSNVPKRLSSASLALGATPWQTALRVVLPTASPGIFSAAMIGFGRAVGETMIVLMATGNTPVLDWSVFTGMRTLSANIAVEIPEAPFASTLYRVLFLAALLLFAATFVVNTLAELVRQRLRQRYQQL